jgi:diacylglycerol kinase (ATP)
MIAFIRSRVVSFRNAITGWWYVIRTQKNAWIHALVSLAVVIVSFVLKINRLEWGLIIFAIALVWTAEFINTALEAVVDLASHQEHHHLAKIGKDVGAAAVLISACSAAVIGFLVLGPPLWQLIEAWLK